MSNVNMEGLPPEMQARIASIIEGAKQKAVEAAAPAAQAPQAPVVAGGAPLAPKTPTLMDHVIMLRQEVAAQRQEMHAVAQVVDAVGQAVGQMYSMFQQQTEPSHYSTNLQTQQQVLDDCDY